MTRSYQVDLEQFREAVKYMADRDRSTHGMRYTKSLLALIDSQGKAHG